MAGEPTLSTMTKVQLGAFATQVSVAHPQQASTVFALKNTLEGKLDQNPQLQNEIIRKLNNNTSATLAEARKIIDKDPKILEEVNKDPTKLATLMGIKMPAPAATAPAVATQTATAQAPASPAQPQAAKPAAPAVPETKTAAAPVTPPKAAAPASVSPAEIAADKQIAAESLKVTQMKGFSAFAARAEQSQSLSQAIDSMMGGNAGKPEDTIKALKDLQSDPEFFVKANQALDEIPEQARESAYEEIAANPQLAMQALKGDKAAKESLEGRVQQREMSNMFGGLLGGGPDGKGGLGNIFGGEGMKGLGEMIQKIIPALMKMFQGMIGKFMGGLQSFTQSPDLMRMGNNPEGTRNFSLTAGKALGVDGGQQRVIDAVDPNAPAVPAAQLGAPKPEITTQGQLRQFEVQQSANEDQLKRQANAPTPPGAG